MKLLIVAVIAVGMAGCQTKPVAEMSYTELMQTAKAIEQRCIDQGVKHPSPEWDICARQEVSREISTRATNRRTQQELGDAIAAGASGFGSAIAANRSTNCHSYRVGNTINTSCY